MRFITHLIAALVVSFGWSIYAWLVLDIFALVPFLTVSGLCAIIGTAIGCWVAGSNILLTIGVTALLRIGAFVFFAGLPPYIA